MGDGGQILTWGGSHCSSFNSLSNSSLALCKIKIHVLKINTDTDTNVTKQPAKLIQNISIHIIFNKDSYIYKESFISDAMIHSLSL